MLSDNSKAKKIIAVVIAFIMIVTVSACTSFFISKRTVQKAQTNLANTIKGDLGEYLAEYEGTRTGISGQLTGTEEEDAVNLTEEQIAAIVEAVSNSIEYNLIKEMISSNSTVSEESISSLEREMSEKIATILEQGTKTAALSDSEKQSMIKTISSIVKADMITVLSEYKGVSDDDLYALKSSLENDLRDVESILASYNSKFSELERSVDSVTASQKTMSSDVTSTENDIKELTNKITELTQEYNTLLTKYNTITNDSLKISSIVDNLNSNESTKVLSANMGRELNESIKSNSLKIEENSKNIYDLLTLLTANAATMNKDLESLKNSTLASLSGIGVNLETLSSDITTNKTQIKAELEQAIEIINDAMASSDAATNATLEATKNAIQTQIANLDSATEQSLRETKNAIEQADSVLKQAIDDHYAELSQTTSNNAQAILNLSNTLNALRESSKTDLQAIADKVTALETALGTNGSSANGTIAEQLDDHRRQLTEISNFINYLQGGSDGKALVGEYDASTNTLTIKRAKNSTSNTP